MYVLCNLRAPDIMVDRRSFTIEWRSYFHNPTIFAEPKFTRRWAPVLSLSSSKSVEGWRRRTVEKNTRTLGVSRSLGVSFGDLQVLYNTDLIAVAADEETRT